MFPWAARGTTCSACVKSSTISRITASSRRLESERCGYSSAAHCAFRLVLNISITRDFVHHLSSVSGETALSSVCRTHPSPLASTILKALPDGSATLPTRRSNSCAVEPVTSSPSMLQMIGKRGRRNTYVNLQDSAIAREYHSSPQDWNVNQVSTESNHRALVRSLRKGPLAEDEGHRNCATRRWHNPRSRDTLV